MTPVNFFCAYCNSNRQRSKTRQPWRRRSKRWQRLVSVTILLVPLIILISYFTVLGYSISLLKMKIFVILRDVGLSHKGPYNRLNVFGNNKDPEQEKLVKNVYYQPLKPPGVILDIKPYLGVGNQFFLHACSYALAKELKWPLYINHAPRPYSPTASSQRSFQVKRREFALDQFKVPLENVFDLTSSIPNVVYLTDQELLEREFIHRNANSNDSLVQLHGDYYCQSIEFWRDYQQEIRSMFELHEWAISLEKIKHMIQRIGNNSMESVAVHVRKGDFVKNMKYFVPISFQRKAMRLMFKILSSRGKTPVFFIFSDDKNYARAKLEDLVEYYNMVFVSQSLYNATGLEEFYLMGLCKHIIFANSTYSWWIAYLIKNARKVVITSVFNSAMYHKPEFRKELYGKLYHPKEWVVIDPFVGGMVVPA